MRRPFFALSYLPLVVWLVVACSTGEQQPQGTAPSSPSSPAVSRSQDSSTPTNQPITIKPISNKQTAFIREKGIDFEYQFVGTVETGSDTITVRYQRQEPKNIQKWTYKFDLNNKTYSSSVQNSTSSEIFPYDENNPFKIIQEEGQTVLLGDAVEEDGSLIVQDAIVVRYPYSESSSNSTNSSAARYPASSSANAASVGTNAVIVGDPSSKNIRSGPGTEYEVKQTAYPGDSIQILESAQDSGGYTWYRVRLPQSGTPGWIAAQLVEVDGSTSSVEGAQAPDSGASEAPAISTGSGGGSSGRCDVPSDIAADGSRCGKRAASERPGGR